MAAACQLDRCKKLKDNNFDLAQHREPKHRPVIVKTRTADYLL